ncbi:MAG: YkgJ family cysteine cluster protein, partial [Desulfobacterales bacterium]|nr:YkgJ family cysteine cluster protein [Desulfobacterales bacterium]
NSMNKTVPMAVGMPRLERVYDVFDRVMSDFPVACGEGCADCCTCNVTLTSLEAAYIFAGLDQAAMDDLAHRVRAAGEGRRYRPVLTTNGFAKACLVGEPVSEEENDPAWGACPLLKDGRCTIYDVRPLGCRNMMSKVKCGDTGYADMPSFALTLNNLFLQYVEGLDTGGFSGNLTDMLALYLSAGEGRSIPVYLSLEKLQDSDKKRLFIGNQPVPAWMVPPEHRDRAAPVLKELNTPK